MYIPYLLVNRYGRWSYKPWKRNMASVANLQSIDGHKWENSESSEQQHREELEDLFDKYNIQVRSDNR